jgi:SAM-dependent methyltransferase
VTELAEPGHANAAQAHRWNGESGRHWIAHRERHLAEHQHLVPHLFRAAQISRGDRVLDVGCGCGATTIAAARAAHGDATESCDRPFGRHDPGLAGRAIGLDLSGPMLAVARRSATAARVADIGFVQGDAQACPLRRDCYDVLISSFGVMFFDDPELAFRRMAAVVHRHGRLAFLCWQHDMHNELFAIPLRAFGDYIDLPGPAVGGLFVDPRQVRGLLSRTGWEDVRIDAINEPAWMGTDVADVVSYVRGMPNVLSLIARLGDAVLAERVMADIAERYATCQRPDGVWVRAAAWLVTARRA